MRKKTFFFAVLTGMFAFTAVGHAEDPLAKYHTNKKLVPSADSSTTPVKSEKPVKRDETLEEVKNRLDKLLKAQDDILKQFEDIKKELYIIKVRASR